MEIHASDIFVAVIISPRATYSSLSMGKERKGNGYRGMLESELYSYSKLSLSGHNGNKECP